MSTSRIRRDERTEAIENKSYRLAYAVVSFGLAISVVYRTYVLGQTSWALIAIMLIGGLVALVNQARHGVWRKSWALAAATAAAAAVLAVVAAVIQRR